MHDDATSAASATAAPNVSPPSGGGGGGMAATSDGSSTTLQQLRDLTTRRRQLLAKCLGAKSADHLSTLLGTEAEKQKLKKRREVDQTTFSAFVASPPPTLAPPSNGPLRSTMLGGGAPLDGDSTGVPGGPVSLSISTIGAPTPFSEQSAFVVAKRTVSLDAPQSAAKRAKARGEESDDEVESFEDYFQVLQEEEQYYRGSISFLKGTQSANPHNDYSQHFVDTGQRPQNFIRDAGLNERFDEYPKLKELIRLKDELVADTATAPMYLKTDLRSFELTDLGSRFDVIIVEPPLEEYHLSGSDCWNWDQIEQLDVASVAENRSFIWLWCGCSPEGLDRGRSCLKKWGFRRCEDICWVKRNNVKNSHKRPLDSNALFQRTKEHCLMGIKGTVRRSTDGDFIHANVDIDLIITDESAEGGNEKPAEIFLIAEHFCLGRRRLHLFGGDEAIRPGWLTVGPRLTSSSFDPKKYRVFFDRPPGPTTGCTDRIETLRPKSPQPSDKRGPPGQGGQVGPGGPKPGRGDSSSARRNRRTAGSYARGRR